MSTYTITPEQKSCILHEWVKCSESLPKFDEDVLICTINQSVKFAKLDHWSSSPNEPFWVADGGTMEIQKKAVTHWMPLPKPPKE